MLDVPWVGSHMHLKAEHPSWHAALRSHLPAWVLRLERQFGTGDANLPVHPGPADATADSDLPGALVNEYVVALYELGYTTLEQGWSSDESAATSESTDAEHLSEALSDGSSGSGDSGHGNAAGADVDDGGDCMLGALDDLVGGTGDGFATWKQESAEQLARLGLSFGGLEAWLADAKKQADGAEGSNKRPEVLAEQLLQREGINQRAVHDYVVEHVQRGETFTIVLQGPAGCGKSFLYDALATSLGEQIAFMAPTGCAALLIGGQTIHGALRINPASRALTPLDNLAAMQELFEGVGVFALDESSMIGRATFGQCIHRLNEIKGENNYSLVIAGDILQLPPVLQQPIWSAQQATGTPTEAAEELGEGLRGIERQQEEKQARVADAFGAAAHRDRVASAKVFVFTQTFRQQQPALRDAVMKFRAEPEVIRMTKPRTAGKKPEAKLRLNAVEDDYAFWRSRHLTELPLQEQADFAADDTLRLFDVDSDRQPKVSKWNEFAFRRLLQGSPGVARKVLALNNCEAARQASTKRAKHPNALYLAPGARVMVRDNLWTRGGIVNGSIGTVRSIIVDPSADLSKPSTVRVVALVELPGVRQIGLVPTLVPGQPGLVPIRMSTSDWAHGFGKKHQRCQREQLPLLLAWAVSIHKSQGLTVGPNEQVKRLIVDFGASEGWAPGLLYVALSRVTHLEALALHPIRVTETGEIEDLPFYNVERFTKVNTSNKSAVIMAHLRCLLEKSAR